MSTYKAWDGNDYPSPPPDGWYQAADDLWWPEGYGPGPAAVTAPAPEPAAAPAPSFEAPRAEAPEFDRDPTTVMPAAQGGLSDIGDGVPAAGVAGPDGLQPGAATGFDSPATAPWSQPPGAAPAADQSGWSQPPGAIPPGDQSEWSQPPGSVPAPGYDPQPANGSSNKGMLIAGAALLALVVVGGLAFALTRGGDDGEVVAFDPTAQAGSAANPHAAGDLVRISYDDPDAGTLTEWTIEAMSPPTDVSDDGDDTADAMVNLRVSLSQAGAPESLSTLSFTAVGSDGKRTSSGGCGPLSTPLPEDRLVSVNEIAEGQVCWQVPVADLAAITMMVEVDGIDGQVHMQLQ